MSNKKWLEFVLGFAAIIIVMASPFFLWSWTKDCLFGWNVTKDCANNAWVGSVGHVKSIFDGVLGVNK